MFVLDADFCCVGFNLESAEQPTHFLQRAWFVEFDDELLECVDGEVSAVASWDVLGVRWWNDPLVHL